MKNTGLYFILRTINHEGEAHNHILGNWYIPLNPANPTFERISKKVNKELKPETELLCIVLSSHANETFLFKESTQSAYIMLDNGSTFECLYSS